MGCLLWEVWRPRYNGTALYQECTILRFRQNILTCSAPIWNPSIWYLKVRQRWEGQAECMVSSSLHRKKWRHDERDGVSNPQPHDCLLNRLLRRQSLDKSLTFVRGIHRWPVNSRTKGQQCGKCFHLMTSSWPKVITVTSHAYHGISILWQINCLFDSLPSVRSTACSD